MEWSVSFSAKASKLANKLPARIFNRLEALSKAIELTGPIQPTMRHFGKLKNHHGEVYHCHLNQGRPTYVAVWQVKNRTILLVEVTYVGTHEKAPY